MADFRAHVAIDDDDEGHLQVDGCGDGTESDVHICLDDRSKSLAYLKVEGGVLGGPRSALEHGFTLAGLDHMVGRCTSPREDFMVRICGRFYRARRDMFAVDGEWLRLRLIDDCRTLDELPTPMPLGIKQMLMSPVLNAGGIIYITGQAASGKSTTAAATIVSRLRGLGGTCYTIEDPPEFPLNGWHGTGYCTQTWVDGKSTREWSEAFRGALRSQPSGTTLMMYIGEVRDSPSALALLRAAASGFLVIATGFATDIPSGIDNLLRLSRVRRGGELTLSNLLRLVIYQRLEHGNLRATALASPTPYSTVASRIRHNELTHLTNDIRRQSAEQMAGRHAFQEHEA